MNPTAKKVRTAGTVVLIVGLVCLILGLIIAMALSLAGKSGSPDFKKECIIVAIAFGVLLIASIVLYVIASVIEHRAPIQEAWEGEGAEEGEKELEVTEDTTVEETAEDTVVNDADLNAIPEEAAPQSKVGIVLNKVKNVVKEKTDLTDEQIETAKEIGKIVVPVVAFCAMTYAVAKLGQYRRDEERRRSFYNWLG